MSAAIGMEVQFFLTSIIWGIILLIIYDVLRIFRRVIAHKWFFVAVEDVLFWVMSAFLIFRMMYQQNNGIIRGFSILGMTLGMVVYNQSLSEYAVRWISKVFLFIAMVIKKVVAFLTKPIRVITKYGKKIIEGLKKRKKASRISVVNEEMYKD